MKTTITVNLGGLVFHIDEDAYEMLNTYLIAIEKQFGSEAERQDILADIEARLAELFTEMLKDKRDVIRKEEVSQVIEILGEPEAFTEGEADPGESSRKKSYTYQATKRLYRDPDNRVLGGVCGGLGAYFNIDAIVFRILFILIFFGMGSGLLIYIILWIAIPEAVTTAQKLEMRGEPITIENIKKAVREEFENVRKNMKF
ncbi:MAG: PspC domain-containing protein [Bacteroidales bacterium]|jgi:phage shock protein PspC (stress-responsive transcriptional regulator)|nr:PspC domain-containing protein [Bacteroidales bacterium]